MARTVDIVIHLASTGLLPCSRHGGVYKVTEASLEVPRSVEKLLNK